MSQRADTGTANAVPSKPSNGALPNPADSGFFRPTHPSMPAADSDTTQLLPAASAVPGGPEIGVIPGGHEARPAPPRVSAQDDTMLLKAVPDVPLARSGAAPPPWAGSSPAALSTPGGLLVSAASTPGTATAIAPPTSAAPAEHRSATLGMWAGVVVFWLLAMPIGVMSAVLVAGRRATLCSKSSTGFGCTSTGSSVGVVLLVIVVALVGTVSVYVYDVRHLARRWLAGLGIGVAMLAVLGLVAWLLVRTIQ